MKAVFHIGRPKTGSTTLQVFLEQNCKVLARRGVFYDRIVPDISSQWEFPIAALAELGHLPPDPYIRRMLGLEDVADARAYADEMMQAVTQHLAAAPKSMHTWVGSSEHAWPYLFDQERIGTFDRLMKSHFDEVTYVVYLRRQEDLILSAYSEAVRRGVDKSFQDFVETFLKKGHGNHMKNLRQWANVAGEERLVVRLLERDALKGGDLVEDFCDVLGTDASGLVRPDIYNPSLTQKSLDAFLLINRHIASVTTKDETLQSLRTELCRASEYWGADGPALTLPLPLLNRIRSQLGPSNEKLRERFFPDREELFPPKTPKAPDGAARARKLEPTNDSN
ncbi:carboxylesterase family protein [Tropicimonas sediminicola]|uniref:Uncharacterized protein n=1 Tax=Tropicimonas sediminicola TaxID=1031541 RepID=A0A239LYG8_9RHOB|nr:carboxylesterase family protein [Tropicimonas sediminicola]SNT34843.1 hypothetical protein SAMN05421757_111127 [Tropicimonas sediminicola]